MIKRSRARTDSLTAQSIVTLSGKRTNAVVKMKHLEYLAAVIAAQLSKKRPLNEFFKLMLAAKKKELGSFQYKGKKYVGRKHPRLGMVYRKQ